MPLAVCLPRSCLSDSFCDRKKAASDQCEWRIISHLSGEESVSSSEPGTVWVNTEQMVRSLSKTNTPSVLVCSPQKEKTRPSVMRDSFSVQLQKDRVAASCDLIHICHHLASAFISLHIHYSFANLQPPSLPPHVICCSPSVIHYRPINLSDGFGTGPGHAGVCLRCDLCTTVRSRDQKAAAYWLSVDLCTNRGIWDVVLYIPFIFWSLSLIIFINTALLLPIRRAPTQLQMHTTSAVMERKWSLHLSESPHDRPPQLCPVSPVSPALAEPSSHQAGDLKIQCEPSSSSTELGEGGFPMHDCCCIIGLKCPPLTWLKGSACLVNVHVFQTPWPQFVSQASC